MSDDRECLKAAADLVDAGEPFVLITVVKTQGSTPRNAGAKMIWRPGKNAHTNGSLNGHAHDDDSPVTSSDVLVGTVGGGQFEMLVIDAAEKHLKDRTCGMEHYILGADADQCCGGTMDVFFEHHGARQRVVIFGAGHVSKSLADLLAAGPLEVVIVDDRPEWASAERFPKAKRVTSWDQGVAAAHLRPEATLACVMTCSHDTDFEILRQLLTNPPAYTGLIGSRSKRVCLFGRLVAAGIDETLVQSVNCPIGVGNTGKEPQLVAISMAAQLLMEARKIACL